MGRGSVTSTGKEEGGCMNTEEMIAEYLTRLRDPDLPRWEFDDLIKRVRELKQLLGDK